MHGRKVCLGRKAACHEERNAGNKAERKKCLGRKKGRQTGKREGGSE